MVGKLKKGSLTALLALLAVSIMVSPFNSLSATAEENNNSTDQTSTDQGADSTGSYDKVSENDSLAMYLSKETGIFYVKNKNTGEIWRSNADGDSNLTASSQLIATSSDQSGNLSDKNSAEECVKSKNIGVKAVSGGVEVTYTFSKSGFVFPVVYKLTNDGLDVSVAADQIKETNSKYTLVSFSLLPYFGSGDASSKGYMLVPDGSGAIINFNNGKSNYSAYQQYVYGADSSKEVKTLKTNTTQANLPVFGIKNGDSAMLAVIDGGACRSLVNAEVASSAEGGNKYNMAYSQFLYRDYTSATFKNKAWDSRDIMMFEKNQASVDQYSVHYYFLPKEQANYTGMALRYQKYLQDEKGVQSTVSADSYPLYVDLFGSVHRLDSFLGFPVYKDIPLTTYSDAEKILSQLKDAGVDDVVLKYDAWLSGGADSSIPLDLKISGALGGKSSFTSLTNYLSSSGISSFFDLNLTNMYADRFGYNRRWDCARGLDTKPAMQHQYYPNLLEEDDDDYAPSYLLRPTKVATAATTIAEKLKSLNISGASLDSLGTELYSSFNKEGNDRVEAEQIWTDSIQKIKDSKGQLMMDSPNAYALPYTTYLSSVPTGSSGYSIEDYAVPFYQIAMHGIASYSAPALNQTSNYQQNFLKALETGSSLQFNWIAENMSKIQDTPYATLFNADYSEWIDDAIQSYQAVSGVLKQVATARIVAHDILQTGVVRTTYENGIRVYVNYTDTAVTVDGVTIDAVNYQVEE